MTALALEIWVDSFAGGGGASKGMEMARGRGPDIGINHDAEAIALHAANHPETEHYTEDVWKVDPVEACRGRRVGVMWLSPDCFPAGTMVLTREGYRAIETIRIGDEVLTHKGRWRAVTETSQAVRPLVRLRGHGHPGLVVSPEHPFYARRRVDVWNNARRCYDRGLEPAGWVPASALDRGWYWATPTAFPAASVPILHAYNGRTLAVTAELLWLAGRYVADGWTRLTDERADLVITCGLHEVDSLRGFLNAWPRAGARSGAEEMAWHERATGTAYQFTTSHRALVEWLRLHFGHGAAEKRIPGWALGMDGALRAAFVDGYRSGDGWEGVIANRVVVETVTVSKALAFGIKALVASLGKTVTVSVGENSTVIGGRTVNALPLWQLRWRVQADPAHVQTFREDGLEWTPIREQESLDEDAPVYNIGVAEDESYVVDGIVVHNCKHFSKAKGGKPVSPRVRGLAWIAVRWAEAVTPRIIVLENVEEFQTWGPVVRATGLPCQARRGQTFRAFVAKLRKLGYIVEWRELRACDYGAPTIRKRLFLVARCDGEAIAWPTPTHGKGRALPWRTAAECIDFSLPCPSIFARKKALAENTLKRIGAGLRRFVFEADRPFIVPVTHHGDARAHRLADPLRTITGAARGEHALITPHLVTYHGAKHDGDDRTDDLAAPLPVQDASNRYGLVSPLLVPIDNGSNGAAGAQPGDDPLSTITAEARHALVAPVLVPRYGEREGQEPRAQSIEKPLSTIVPTQNGASLVAGFLARHYTERKPGEVQGVSLFGPAPTVTTIDHNALVTSYLEVMHGTSEGRSVGLPAPAVLAQGTHLAEVRAFLVAYYGTEQKTGSLFDPAPTVTAKDRFGLVTVDGQDYQLADIGMRMLAPRELYRAQGFPDSYKIDIPFTDPKTGKTAPMTKTAQVRMCGNSVCPDVAAAIIRANVPAVDAGERAA